MSEAWCPVCGSELWTGLPCQICVNRKREEEQIARALTRTQEWYAERLKEKPLEWPAKLHRPDRWGYGGQPEWDRDSSFERNINWILLRLNELHETIEDLKFELAEKEAENDHRCCQCGLPEGRQVT